AAGASGLSAALAHELALRLGADVVTVDEGSATVESRLAANAEVVNVPGALRDGAFTAGAGAGAWTAVSGGSHVAGSGLTAARSQSRVLLAGRYWRGFARDEEDRLRGRALLLGIGSGFDHFQRTLPGLNDRMTMLDVLGPWVQGVIAGAGGLRVRAGVE